MQMCRSRDAKQGIDMAKSHQKKIASRLKATAVLTTAVSTTALATIPSAHAQNDQARDGLLEVETLIVTARKVEEAVQEIPVAITAFGAQAIREQSISQLEDVALLTPGLVFEDFSNGGFGTPTIRGATQFSINTLEQNVSVLLDGIYIPRQYAFDIGSMNLERIEVVKGPQSALYGANAFSGAINYISYNRSLTDWQASGQIDVSENGGFDILGKVNAPVIKGKLSVRLAAGYSRFDGDWENEHPDAGLVEGGIDDDFSGYKKFSIQSGFTARLADRVELDVDYYHFNTETEPRAQFRIDRAGGDFTCSLGGVFGPPSNQLFCGELPSIPTDRDNGIDGFAIDPRSTGLDSETDMVRINLSGDISNTLKATYLFGYIQGDVFSAGGADNDPLAGTNFSFFGPPNIQNAFSFNPVGNFDYVSHELRLEYASESGIYAMFGGFLQRGDDFDNSDGIGVALRDLTPITDFPGGVGGVNTFTQTNVNAVFARVAVPLLDDRMKIEFEGRYTDEEKITTQDGVVLDAVYEESYFTPRASIDYKLTDQNLLYASIARGVKTGGINTSNVALTDEERTFGPDSNWTYEIGVKNTFLGGLATLNAALFYIDWSDLQLQITPENGSFLTAGIVDNIGSATSKGFEIEGVFQVTDFLTLNAGLAYIDASYGDDAVSQRVVRGNFCGDGTVCNANGDISGNALQRTSDLQWNVGIAGEDAMTDTLDYFWRADVMGQSEQFVSEINVATIEPRTLVNLRLGLRGENWSASIYAKNLFDEEYVSNAFYIAAPFFGTYVPALGNQRRVGATFSYDY